MYTMAIHCQQVLTQTLVAVSISETDDDGSTYPLATAMSSSDLLASSEEDPLWVFLQQVSDAVSIALGNSQDIYRQAIERDRIDGGWGGAGQESGPNEVRP